MDLEDGFVTMDSGQCCRARHRSHPVKPVGTVPRAHRRRVSGPYSAGGIPLTRLHAADTLLARALARAPRRFLVRPLPADRAAAAAAGAETALAFAMEAVRAGTPEAPEALQDLFTSALAAL